ncbi:MAG: LytTR family transcriptional regulator [Clostridia bacterium]|nr:LytTR family transcriptional regulator [Clostridia bacterium]
MKFKLIIDKDCEEEIVAKVHSANDFTRKIEDLVLSYVGSDCLTVQGDYEILTIKFVDIECITVIDRKLYVIDRRGEKYRTSGTLSEIEKMLPSYFIRINKSSIANERKISCFKTTFSGGVDAVFNSGYKEYVSRRCFAEIKRRYKV